MRYRQHKYRVSDADERRYRGMLYDSKAEMNYAIMLDELMRVGEIRWWLRQIKVPLGEDDTIRIDFIVAEAVGQTEEIDVYHPEFDTKHVPLLRIYGVEVKGVETARWRRQKKLWSKYGPFELRIVHRQTVVEILSPASPSS